MKIILVIICIIINACTFTKKDKDKRDTREIVYLPNIIHKKNVNITLDSSFFQLISKHYPNDLCSNTKCVNRIDEFYFYNNCNFANVGDFEKNNTLIKKILDIETIFQYNEKGLLVRTGSLNWDTFQFGKSAFTKQNPQIEVFYLCYRSYEKINNSCQLSDRYYIISLDGLMIKDIIALNLPQNVNNMLHAMPNVSIEIDKEDWAIRNKLKDYQVLEFYYYTSPKWSSCKARYKAIPYPHSPVVSLLQESKFLKGVYATIDKNANIEIDKHNIYFKSNTFHNSIDSTQKLYNILPYK